MRRPSREQERSPADECCCRTAGGRRWSQGAARQEAVAVGASAALRPDDYVFATYRGHHHAMARGASPEACLAELMSKATGLCKAKGGSMHLTKADGGMLGSYAIVGSHLPMAVGAA